MLRLKYKQNKTEKKVALQEKVTEWVFEWFIGPEGVV